MNCTQPTPPLQRDHWTDTEPESGREKIRSIFPCNCECSGSSLIRILQNDPSSIYKIGVRIKRFLYCRYKFLLSRASKLQSFWTWSCISDRSGDTTMVTPEPISAGS